MSNEIDNVAPATVRLLIEQYIQGRLNDKLHQLKPDDIATRDKLLTKYEVEAWLEDASLRISQIRLVTHTPKQHHPSSKASAIFFKSQNVQHNFIGSVEGELEADVIGNAAVLDVFKLLRLEHRDRSLLDRLLSSDQELINALSNNPEQAQIRYKRFLAFSEMPEQLNAGRLSKQVYFPTSNDEYHILTLLYPSSLVHRVYKQLSHDRFSEQSKALREARFKALYSPLESREYPKLMMQNYGGSKPQNISQLNSDRRGSMWLLPSLPPVWSGLTVKLPKNDSVFSGYLSSREDLKPILNELVSMYRNKNLKNNIDLRHQRDALVQQLIDCVIDMSIELQQSATPGWTIEKQTFNRAESYWLDLGYREQLFDKEERGSLEEDEKQWLAAYRGRDWHNEIGDAFGQWLNQILMVRAKVHDLDDDVGRVWSIKLRDQIGLLKEEFA